MRWRKWFWAGVGVVILVLIVWVFIPENDKDWKPFTFEDELAALEAKNKIPDGENAAIIYNKLIADYNKSDFEPNFITCEIDDILMSEYWSAKDYPQAAKWIKSHKETINRLIQASKFEKCKFDVTSKTLFSFDMERLGIFRRWAQLLSRATNNDIAEGKIEQGLKKNYCTLQMGNHLCQQSFLIQILSGMAIKNIAISNLKDFIVTGNVNKKQLNTIEGFINEVKYDWQSDLPRVLDYEKLLMKNLCGIFYEVNSKGRFRFIRNPKNAIKFLSPEFNEIPSQNYFQKKFVKASSIIYWFFIPATPQEISKTIDTAYQKYYEMTDPNFDWSRQPKPTEFPLSFFELNYKLNYKYMIKGRL